MNLPAGRELDKLVAEHVMGLEPWPGKPGAFKAPIVLHYQTPKPCLPPEYSTDISAAWQVRNMIGSKLFSIRRDFREALQTIISNRLDKPSGILIHESEIIFHVEPVDICLAALRAVSPETVTEEC